MSDDWNAERERFVSFRESQDRRLRDRLVEDNLWLAQHWARRYASKGEPQDDLEQVASLALVKAVDRFDPEVGVRFTTFAAPTIVGELRRHFRDKKWSVRVSRRLKDLHVELRSTNEQLTQDLGRAPSIDELADVLRVSPEEVLEALEVGGAYQAASLSRPPDVDGEDIDPGGLDDALEETDERLAVRAALEGLPERDRRVVYLRFYKGLTQAEIADAVGVSQVHVSRILRSALDRLGDDPELADAGAGS